MTNRELAIREATVFVNRLIPEMATHYAARAMCVFAIGKMMGILGDDWPETFAELDNERRCLLAYFCACSAPDSEAR